MAQGGSDFSYSGDYIKQIMNKETITLQALLEKLYEECKHGDEEHQQWLKDKIVDFGERHKNIKIE